MTREELEKEAREYLEEHSEYSEVFGQTYVAVDTLTAMVDFAEPREKRIAELEAQNEKMKCCANCKHFNKESDIEYCQNCERQLVNSLDNFPREEIIKDEWELRR